MNRHHPPDHIGGQLDPECTHSVVFYADQWVLCQITCEHGVYKATSDGWNFSEAHERAMVPYHTAHGSAS
jgi:hypothetical protein